MQKTKFKSIRTKLISNTMLMISLIFLLVLSSITVMNIRTVHKNMEKAEQNIRNSLIAKGKTLANNNAMAMRGMAEDNAFIAIQTLVSSTVKDDDDIEYGIFMNDSRVAWVNASSENPSGKVQSPDPLTDPLSQWASNLRSLSHKAITYGDEEHIEFAAPVIFEEDVLGVIRYGFNTRSMNKALKEALENGRQTRNQTILVLLFLGGLSLGISYLVVRHLASAITRPIGALVQSTKAISEGNYHIRIEPESNDEVGNLAADFEAMRQTIKKYTDHLQELVDEKMQQVNDILNNIDQGLFTINLDGSVNDEYSARANEILKVRDIASSSLRELFRMDEKQEKAFRMWMDLVRNKHGAQRWKKLTRLAPVHELELSVSEDIPGYISIEYQKIYNKNGELSKIMILALDETEKRIKELQMKKQQQEHQNEMKIILGLVNTPLTEISGFVGETTALIIKMRQQTDRYLSNMSHQRASDPDTPEGMISDEQINDLYREMHTIKGNSGSYGFEMLSAHAHQTEDMLERLRAPDETPKYDTLKHIRRHLGLMDGDMKEIQEKIQLIFGREEDATMRIPKSHIRRIKEACAAIDKSDQAPEVLYLVNRCVMLSWVPIETIARKYQKIVSRVARKRRKNIRFMVSPEHIFYPPDILSDIDDALVHLVRNAADHGIEPPEVREELSKGGGLITLEFQVRNNTRVITISDDGKGIDTEKLLETCIRKGGITAEEAAALSKKKTLELIFAPGISTTDEVSDISGRGMGMDVVQKKVEDMGGSVSIDSKPDQGTSITLILPHRRPSLADVLTDEF